MPEVSIDENCDAIGRKHYVRRTWKGADVAAESQSFTSKLPLHLQLKGAVLQLHALHGAGTLLGSHGFRPRSRFTLALMFSRTVTSLDFAWSVSKAV